MSDIQIDAEKLAGMNRDDLLTFISNESLKQAIEKIVDRKSDEIATKILDTLSDRIDKHAALSEQKIHKLLVDKMPV